MLHTWLVSFLIFVCFLSTPSLGSDLSQKTLEGYKISPTFQTAFQKYTQLEQKSKSSWERAWNKMCKFFSCDSTSREYDVFTWWWIRQCMKDNSIDPTGLITRDLITKAAGFGGWYTSKNPKGVRVDELRFYKSVVFLYYWLFYDAPEPRQGPLMLKKLWKAAQQKQCLRIESHFIPLSDWKEWLKQMVPSGWNPEEKSINDAINEKFEISDPAAFEKEWGEKWLAYYGPIDSLKQWLGGQPYAKLLRLYQVASDALETENLPVDVKRVWLKNILALSRVMTPNRMLNLIKEKEISYLGCLYMVLAGHELIDDDDIDGFRDFLRTFDPERVDIEHYKMYLRWLNIALSSSFNLKWQAHHGDKEKKLDNAGQDSPVAVFQSMYNEEAEKGLWPSFQNDGFPHILLFLAFTRHSDVESHSPVYQAALTRTLRQTYDVETVQGLQEFLWDYLIQISVALEARNAEDECEHPFNIWEGDNKDIIQQRISMALDYLLSGVWPKELPCSFMQRNNKLAMLLLVYQRAQQEKNGIDVE